MPLFDMNQLDLLEQGYQQHRATRQQELNRLQTTPKRGNFLTSLIPAGTGTAGAVGGAALGTAILPGAGTLVGALLGGALGGGAGKVAENAVEGNSLTKGVAGEAALSGVLGAGPLRLGKFGIEALRGIKAGGGLTDALVNAGTKASTSSVKNVVGQKLNQASNDLVVKNFRLTPTQLTNFKNKFGEDASAVIKRYKLTGKDAESIRQNVLQPLQGEFDTIATKIPAIPAEALQSAFKSKYNKLINSAVEDNRSIGKQLKQQADTITKKYGSTIDANELNLLRREFDDLVTYADKTANPARYGVNKRAADALRSVLQGTADKVGLKATNGMTFKEVGRELNKLHQLTDNISRQEGLGRGSLPAGITQLLGGMLGAGVGGPAAALGGAAAVHTINSPLGRKVVASGTEKLGSKLTGRSGNPYSIASTTARVAPLSLTTALLENQRSLPNEDNNTMTPTITNPMRNAPSTSNMPGLSQTDANMSTSPFAPDNLESAIQQIIANGGTLDDVTKFAALASTIQKIQSAGQPQKKLNATQLQQANNAQSGLDSLQTIRQSISDNPNAPKLSSLPGGSFTRSLTGTGSYDAAISNATDVIGRLRSGGAINADEEARFRSLLPSTFDDQETIDYKLNTLAQLFQRFVNPQGAQDQPDDLTSALLSAQGAY